MRRAQLLPLLALPLSLGVACGPEVNPQTPTTATTASASASAPTTSATEVAEAPVPEPEDLVGIGRWRNPQATANTLASCAGVPSIFVDANARVGAEAILRQIAGRSLDTRKLAGLMAMDASIDAVAVLAMGPVVKIPEWAVSVGLSSVDGAKKIFDPNGAPEELEPGVWVSKKGARCALAEASGSAPARLICATRAAVLPLVAKYMARTAPLQDWGGPDIHIEPKFAPAKKRYGALALGMLRSMPGALVAEFGMNDATFDALLTDTGAKLQDEAGLMLEDLSGATLDVEANPSTCVRATLQVDMGLSKSWIGKVFMDRVERAGPPPAVYWRLPKDSAVAAYGRGQDPALFSPALKRLGELLSAGLAAGKLGSPADRKKMSDLMSAPYGKDANVVIGSGPIPRFKDPAGKDAAKDAAIAAFGAAFGWSLIGIEAPAADVKGEVTKLFDAYKTPFAQALLKDILGSDVKNAPTVKSVKAPPTLGAGAEAWEITFPAFPVSLDPATLAAKGGPAKAPAKQNVSLVFHVLLMADGQTAWLGLGAAKDEVVRHLLAAKTGAPDTGTLGARAGLDELRQGKHMAAGFLTLEMLPKNVGNAFDALTLLFGAPRGDEKDLLDVAKLLGAAPNKGETPIFITQTATKGEKNTVSLSMHFQQGTFEDARSVATSGWTTITKLMFGAVVPQPFSTTPPKP